LSPEEGPSPWRLYGDGFISKRLDELEASSEERNGVWFALITLCQSPSGSEDVRVTVAEGPAKAEVGTLAPNNDRYIARITGGFMLVFELWPSGVPPLRGKLLVPRSLDRHPALSSGS